MYFRRDAAAALALFSFLVRVYYSDNETMAQVERELRETSDTTLDRLNDLFYDLYQRAFSGRVARTKYEWCTINTHHFYHVLKVRRKLRQSWHDVSAEPFESFYGILQQCYRKGTLNVPKQLITHSYMRQQ